MSAEKRMRGRFRCALLAAVALWAGAVSQAQACSCVAQGSPQQELAQSAAVFRGTVLEVGEPEGPFLSNRAVTFGVRKVWKGPLDPLVSITTPTSGASCGYNFVRGEEYVVYALAEASRLTVYLCTRTRALAVAGADLTALGSGETPAIAPLGVLLRHALIAGSWYNARHSGEGFVVEVLGDGRGVVYWVGYQPDASGRQSWLVGTGEFQGDTLIIEHLLQPVGGGFGSDFNPNTVERVDWGQLRMEFGRNGRGHIRWESTRAGYESGNFPIERLTRPPQPSFLPGS